MWPDAIETKRLLKQVEQADPTAADELWERHRPALRRMIELRLDQVLGRRVDASDIVQDVLLRASQRLGEYLRNPALPFHLWLRQIARDHVIDAHRRHRGAGKRRLPNQTGLYTLDLLGKLLGPSSFRKARLSGLGLRPAVAL